MLFSPSHFPTTQITPKVVNNLAVFYRNSIDESGAGEPYEVCTVLHCYHKAQKG